MQLRHYVGMIIRGWWIIALASLSGLMLALVAAYNEEPRYRTSTRLIVSPNATLINSGQFIYSLDTLDKRSIVTTYSEVLNSNRLFESTGEALQIDPAQLNKYSHSTVVIPEANILELYIDGPNPELAALLANNLSDRAIDYVRETYQVYDLDVLDPAGIPTEPFVPQPIRDAALAGVLGAMLGAALAVLEQQLKLPLEALRRRSMVDQASQALNRQTFLKQGIEQLKEPGTATLGLIELGGLSELIGSLPQPVAQRILRTVHTTLQHELRGSDMIGRWSEDTFAVLLNKTPHTAADRIFSRIADRLSKPIELGLDNETVELMPYVGIAGRSDDLALIALIDQAEQALDQSTRRGARSVLSANEISI